MTRLWALCAAFVLVVLLAIVAFQPGRTPADTAKFLSYQQAGVTLIPGRYLVIFEDARVPEASVPALARSLAGGRPNVAHVFTAGLRGFAARNLSDAWARRVSARADVRLVGKDFVVRGKELRGGPFQAVPWDLDRVDQRTPLDRDRDYRLKTGPVGAAPPVPVYVLDNGVFRGHSEFGTRVENVADVTGQSFARCSGSAADHGTGVASLVAGAKFGITRTLVKNVKVLQRGILGDCLAGSVTTVVAGLERTLQDMRARQITKAVVNLSMGWNGAPSPAVQMAIKSLQDQGALVVAAAGNENLDAANTEPANLPGVLAVGATDQSGARSQFAPPPAASNYGATIDLWAPGSNVTTADWPGGANPDASARTVASGTSMAAPLVAGAAALLWQQNPNLIADQVQSALLARSTRHMLTGLGAGSGNRLLYVGEDAPAPGPQRQIVRQGGRLSVVEPSADGTRVYVGGDDVAGGTSPLAAFDTASLGSGPLWSLALPGIPADAECIDIRAGELPVGSPTGGRGAYAACMGTHLGAREAFVVATQEDGKAVWPQPAWLGPGTAIAGVTGEITSTNLRVYTIGTRPSAGSANATEVFVASLDADDGHVVNTVPLTAPGFSEPFHQAVDLVLVEVANPGGSHSTELVAATYSDPPGADKTFLWKLDPDTLQVTASAQLPDPQLATNGMFATALAVQPLEENGSGIRIPAEVFLATQVGVASPNGGTEPWAYLYRLNADRVTAQAIDVVKDAHVSRLSSQDGDLYFAGITTRTFAPGDVLGTRKPGPLPDFDVFIGKSEGVFSSRRWMRTFGSAGHDSGHGAYGREKAYIASEDANTLSLVQHPVY
jgi:subtilisin family serine protease